MQKSVPEVTFKTRVRDESVEGENPFRWQDQTTDEIFGGKRIALFSLPGAFTPTCSSTHLPGFEKHYEDLKALGIDEVIFTGRAEHPTLLYLSPGEEEEPAKFEFRDASNLRGRLVNDRIQDLHRVARELPVTLAAFAVGGVCIMGLPPSGNFIGKWLLIEAAFAQGEWGWAVVVVAGGLLSAAYVFRVLGHAFTVDDKPVDPSGAPASMAWAAFALALLALTLGVFAAPLVDLIGAPGESAVAHLSSREP